jgi:hypothetical protein
MRAKATYPLVVIALALSGVAYAALSDGHRDGPGLATASHLRVSGHVEGLYPGARKGLRLELRNGSRHWTVVRAVSAAVTDGSPGCSPRFLSTVPRDLKHPRIRPHKTRRLGIRVRMWPGAPDACQGATFPVRFKVRAAR